MTVFVVRALTNESMLLSVCGVPMLCCTTESGGGGGGVPTGEGVPP